MFYITRNFNYTDEVYSIMQEGKTYPVGSISGYKICLDTYFYVVEIEEILETVKKFLLNQLKGQIVHVQCHGVTGKIEQSTEDGVTIRKENGETASYYFDQISKNC